MKKIGLIYLFVALFSAGFVACTEDNIGGQGEKKFTLSEVEELDVALLDSVDYIVGHFTFDAPSKWAVTSDQMMWVTFSKSFDGEYYPDITGDAGNNTVYVKISNDGREYNIDKANITIVVGDGEYTVSSIERPGKKWLNIIANDGSVVDVVELDQTATGWVSFQAPFDCAIIEWPEWLVAPVYENDGYRLTVVDSLDLLQNPLDGMLLVSDATSTIQSAVPVKYSGMDPTIMEITGDSPWNWLVSIDGKEIKSKQALDSVVIKESLEMNLVCRNNDYSIIFAEEIDSVLYPKSSSEAWIKAVVDEQNPRAVSVKVDSAKTNATRSGYLFAVPAAVCDSFNIALSSCDSTINIVDKYEKYVLAQIEQRDAGFDVVHVENGVETKISCSVDETADYYIIISNNYFNATDPDVSACNVEYGKSYTINTKLTKDEWIPTNFVLYDINGEEIRIKTWIPEKEAVLGDDGYYRLNIVVPDDASWFEENEIAKDVVLRLYTRDVVNIKALVLRVQE